MTMQAAAPRSRSRPSRTRCSLLRSIAPRSRRAPATVTQSSTRPNGSPVRRRRWHAHAVHIRELKTERTTQRPAASTSSPRGFRPREVRASKSSRSRDSKHAVARHGHARGPDRRRRVHASVDSSERRLHLRVEVDDVILPIDGRHSLTLTGSVPRQPASVPVPPAKRAVRVQDDDSAPRAIISLARPAAVGRRVELGQGPAHVLQAAAHRC